MNILLDTSFFFSKLYWLIAIILLSRFYTNLVFLILSGSDGYFILFSVCCHFFFLFTDCALQVSFSNNCGPFPQSQFFTFRVHPLTSIFFVSVCLLHDVITEEVDSSRRRNPGLSLLLVFSILFSF